MRDAERRTGEPIAAFATTHILKPDQPDSGYDGLATNEYFCMRLAAAAGLPVARVRHERIGPGRCLVVERFDRDPSSWPPRRLHQEDLCQALGLTPDFKYHHQRWRNPSYRSLAGLLDDHSTQPGRDRLTAARSAVFNFVVGNAGGHGKNISLLHVARRPRRPGSRPAARRTATGATGRVAAASGSRSFNGAPAVTPGRPAAWRSSNAPSACFNGAPAVTPGRRRPRARAARSDPRFNGAPVTPGRPPRI